MYERIAVRVVVLQKCYTVLQFTTIIYIYYKRDINKGSVAVLYNDSLVVMVLVVR